MSEMIFAGIFSGAVLLVYVIAHLWILSAEEHKTLSEMERTDRLLARIDAQRRFDLEMSFRERQAKLNRINEGSKT